MVGRYRKGLTLHSVGASSNWPALIKRANVPVGLNLIPVNDSYLPTNTTSFYARGISILSAFTGAHANCHTPRDTPDKLNYPSMKRLARFVTLLLKAIVSADEPPDYIATQSAAPDTSHISLLAYLGTIPDYGHSGLKGMKLSGIAHPGDSG